ncbi:MAG: gamma-glutamylcyclotransferase [Pseudomonas sp.]|nr:gamma-glutamylcyclotransferase [Pseudomonas sp.]
MKYIAYGSNMVESQMAHRCPNAKLIGMGYLPNHRLEFYLHATVERSQAKGAKVPVAVWEIDEEDEWSLDRYEGVPTYYTKQRRKVIMNDGSEIYGMVYIMKMIRPAPPAARYYDAIADAYADLGIGSEIARVLEPALQRSKQRSRFSIR